MRKIIVYIATSADGYIARPDGNVDWLNSRRFAGDYGMRAFYRSIDTILWGRKTYDVALEFQKQGIKGAAFDPKVQELHLLTSSTVIGHAARRVRHRGDSGIGEASARDAGEGYLDDGWGRAYRVLSR